MRSAWWATKLKNMREIKFRFWDKDLKKMCHRNPLTYDFSVENIIPLQFTGHKDCDGKEIFDGDILGDWNECDGQMVLSNEVVYFDETLGSWMLDHSLKKDHSFATSLFENLNDFAYKVIGNIYENPDLVMVASEADA